MATTRLGQLKKEMNDLIVQINSLPDVKGEEQWKAVFKFSGTGLEKCDDPHIVPYCQAIKKLTEDLSQFVIKVADLFRSINGTDVCLSDFIVELITFSEETRQAESKLNQLLEIFDTEINKDIPGRISSRTKSGLNIKLLSDFLIFLAKKNNESKPDASADFNDDTTPVEIALLALDLPEGCDLVEQVEVREAANNELISENKELPRQTLDTAAAREAYLTNLLILIDELINDAKIKKDAEKQAKIFAQRYELYLKKLTLSRMSFAHLRNYAGLQAIEDSNFLYQKFYLEPKLEAQARLHGRNFVHVFQDDRILLNDPEFKKMYTKHVGSVQLNVVIKQQKMDCVANKNLKELNANILNTYKKYRKEQEPILNEPREALVNKVIKTIFSLIFTGVIFYPLVHHSIWGAKSENLTTQNRYYFLQLLSPSSQSSNRQTTITDWRKMPKV